MELITSVLLGLSAIALGLGLIYYAVRGRRESQARDARTYKRGRL